MKEIIFKIGIIERRFIYTLLYFFDKLFFRKDLDIIVLCYHSIASDGWRFSVNKKVFEWQIKKLLKTRKPISVEDLFAYLQEDKEIDGPAFLLCFDDGYKDILQVKQFLKNRGVKPLVFVLSKKENAEHRELGTKRELLGHEDILELKSCGWGIGSHSATHPDFESLDEDGKETEIKESRLALQKSLGFPVEYFAYPRGKYGKEIIEKVQESGYKLAFSMDDGVINTKTNNFAIPRIGVDRTHLFFEFNKIYSPSAVSFRRFVKKTMRLFNRMYNV